MHFSSVEGSTKPLVVLLHYTFGNHMNLQRHVELFNELGFSTVTFNLFAGSSVSEPSPFKSWEKYHVLYTLWVRQITEVLDSLEGPKIFFSMSFPSVPALIACSERTDIVKYICDGGPFTRVVPSIYRLWKQQGKFSSSAWGWVLSAAGYFYLGPLALRDLRRALARWPAGVPILSMRGADDHVVTPKQIDAVFAPFRNIDFTVGAIPGAGHLDGLKKQPQLYSETMLNFLREN